MVTLKRYVTHVFYNNKIIVYAFCNKKARKKQNFMTKQNENAKAKKVTNAKAEMPKIKVSKVDEIFRLVKDKEGVKITCGNYLVSKKTFKTFNEAEEYLTKKPYEILINCTCLFAEMHMKNQKQEKK